MYKSTAEIGATLDSIWKIWISLSPHDLLQAFITEGLSFQEARVEVEIMAGDVNEMLDAEEEALGNLRIVVSNFREEIEKFLNR
jgi:hypothetical protein